MYSHEVILKACETIFSDFHNPQCIHPDPLEIPKSFGNQRDQEISGFFAATLALGRVELFMPVLHTVFARFPRPAEQLSQLTYREILGILKGSYYRFFSSESLAGLLFGLSTTLTRFGTLEACYLASEEPTHLARLEHLRNEILGSIPIPMPTITIPHPLGVAKRLHLFSRWMVRQDSVDLGIWKQVNPAELFYPLDTHIYQISKFLRITQRRTADKKSMEEITAFFRIYYPADPVKFDFSLSRIGLGKGMNNQEYEKTIQKYLE